MDSQTGMLGLQVLGPLLLVLGLLVGAGGAFLLARGRFRAEEARLRAEMEAILAQARAAQATLSERLRGAEAQLAAQRAELRADVDAARAAQAQAYDALRAETALRASAEESAARVPGLEARVRAQAEETATLMSREADLLARMEEERKAVAEKLALMEDVQLKLQDTFKALSSDALKHNNQSFLQLAGEHLAKVQEASKGDLELRQKTIEGLVKPIRESLTQVDARIQEMEKSRQGAYVELTQQVKFLASDQVDLKRETRKLVEALRRPTVRGRWGEMQLRRVVELAGMTGYCDFSEQTSVTTEDGRLRPDMVVRLPGGKNVVVDAKAPLEAYLDAYESTDEDARLGRMQVHARQIRDHLNKLGQKSYWEHLQPTPEFVVMFLPGEIFFSSALEHDPSLIEEGVNQKVIVASPTTLIALLRAVAYGWRQECVAESAQQVSDLGRELYKRLTTLTEHFIRVGKGLGTAVEAYNKTVSSLESRVLVQARRFRELGAAPKEQLPEPEQLEKTPREMQPGEE